MFFRKLHIGNVCVMQGKEYDMSDFLYPNYKMKEREMNNNNHTPTGSIVAQGWILMFLVFICIFIVEFLNAVIVGNLSLYTSAEGQIALKVIVLMMLLHAFVPMLVCTFNARWFRWAIAGLTLCFALAMIAHELVHIFIAKNKQFGLFDALDFAHHGLGIWVACVAVRWAREAEQVFVPTGLPA